MPPTAMTAQADNATDPEEQQAPETPEPANPLGGDVPFDTLTDVLIPLCILGMVASFTYFLIEIRAAYFSGGNELLKYVFFWFLIGVVCISRLRAKYGGQVVATPYMIALGGVMVLFVMRFAQRGGSLTGGGSGAWITLVTIALAWWAIHRLTDECTVVEDRQDESEESLLSSFGKRSRPGAPQRRRHPGRLVILFGLAALGVFALTQPVVEHAGDALARRAFAYMVAYLLCTLALLSLTSLSGLKLYVRQRGADMDRHLSPAWMLASLLVIAAILIAAAMIPRVADTSGRLIVRRVMEGIGQSRQELPVSSPVEGVRAPDGGRVLGDDGEGEAPGTTGQSDSGTAGGGPSDQGASGSGKPTEDGDGGTGKGSGSGQGEGAGEESAETQSPESPQGERQTGEGGGEQRGESPPADGGTDTQGQAGADAEANGADSGTQSADEQPSDPSEEQTGSTQPSAPEPPPTPQSPPPDLRVLLWIALALGVIAVLYALARLIPAFGRFLRKLADLRFNPLRPLQQMLNRVAQFLQRLFARKQSPKDAAAAALTEDPLKNPFVLDRSVFERLSPNQVIKHSYLALLHYADTKGCRRRDDQTPLEFLRALPPTLDHVREELTLVTRLYIEAAYTTSELPPAAIERVRPVWHKLEELLSQQKSQSK